MGPEQITLAIRSLNLDDLVEDLVRGGMDRATADRGVELYREFHCAIAAFPREVLVPCRLVDKVWHAHMLRPVAYHADCMVVHGRIIDHTPGVYGTPEYDDAYYTTRLLVSYGKLMPENPYAADDLMAGAECFRQDDLPDETPLGVKAVV